MIYTNVDWAGCANTRLSTSGYAMFLGANLVSWSSNRQNVVSRLSVEVEFRAVANGVAEATVTMSALSTSPPTPFSIGA
jgi:hypothetical protein